MNSSNFRDAAPNLHSLGWVRMHIAPQILFVWCASHFMIEEERIMPLEIGGSRSAINIVFVKFDVFCCTQNICDSSPHSSYLLCTLLLNYHTQPKFFLLYNLHFRTAFLTFWFSCLQASTVPNSGSARRSSFAVSAPYVLSLLWSRCSWAMS